MPIQGITINFETIRIICKNFPAIAKKKVSSISRKDIKTILMIENINSNSDCF